MFEINKIERSKLKNSVALGLAIAALAGLGEKPGIAAADAPSSKTNVESTSSHEPILRLGEGVIADMNRPGGRPNIVYGGALLIEEGTPIYHGPIVHRTERVKKNEAILVQMPRLAYYGGKAWAVGYVNRDSRLAGYTLQFENMRWFDLGTANYDTYAYPSVDHPGKYITPRSLKITMIETGRLRLVDKFNTVPLGIPTAFGLMTTLKSNHVKPQVDYLGLVDLHDKYKPGIK